MYAKSGQGRAATHSTHRYMTTGVAGAAMVGLFALAAAAATVAMDEPTAVSAQSVQVNEIKLVSCETSGGVAAPGCSSTQNLSAAVKVPDASKSIVANAVGASGWLIGNGADAALDCTGAACNEIGRAHV